MDDVADGASSLTLRSRSRPTRTSPLGPARSSRSCPRTTHGLGRSFDDEVEAEVAELLGETDAPAEPGRTIRQRTTAEH